MPSRVVTFSSGTLTLEGILDLPESSERAPGVVVCHPHPRMGGSMANNVVMAACYGLRQAGIASLRFNFRGVGRSQGSYADGVGEKEDVKAAISFLSSQEGIDPDRIGLAGYSFGSRVCLSLIPEEDRIKALALVSPPAEMYKMEKEIRKFDKPKYVMIGSEDNFMMMVDVIPDFFRHLLDPREYMIVQGADHFWVGFEQEITSQMKNFFSMALGGAGVKRT